MDWSSNADPEVIGQLKGVIDEVVVQTYQGRHSIPNYSAYLPRLNRLGLGRLDSGRGMGGAGVFEGQ